MDTILPSFPILVIGALGQIGQDLVAELEARYGSSQILQADLRSPEVAQPRFFELDVTDQPALSKLVSDQGVKTIFHLAAILSAKGEQHPTRAWDINMSGLLNVLEVARAHQVERVFWPSSIAVFGESAPRVLTPQQTLMDPSTVYGISKVAGEQWCAYYRQKYGVDVRSIRYPGLIGHTGLPGGGTTDYAVDIYHAAVKGNAYTSFLRADTRLPMMYMPDAIRATIELMEAPPERLSIRTAYNLQGLSFTPEEIFAAIQAQFPSFSIRYAPDFRQEIADSWPESLDDQVARRDWGWKPAYDLTRMTHEMLAQLKARYAVKV